MRASAVAGARRLSEPGQSQSDLEGPSCLPQHLTCLQHDRLVKAITLETILLAKKLVCPPPQLLSHRCH